MTPLGRSWTKINYRSGAGARLWMCATRAGRRFNGVRTLRNLATVHSEPMLPLQLREGDDTPLDRNRPPRIICTEARAGGSLDAKELVDGRVWVSGKESEKEPLAITHVVRVLREAPESAADAPSKQRRTSRTRKVRELEGWEQRLCQHDADKYDGSLPKQPPRKVDAEGGKHLASGRSWTVTPEDREADLSTFVILKDEDDLTDALKTFADYVDNIKATWTAANPARILIVDTLDERPWKGCVLGAAYCAREEGWSGDEALRFVGTRCSEAGAPYAYRKGVGRRYPERLVCSIK